MNIRERAIKLLKDTGQSDLGTSVFQKAKLFCWDTGLGPVLNALPNHFGQQAVLSFPGRSGKFALPCCESEGKILLAASGDDLGKLRGLLLQNPGAEIWLKDGWYAGTARLLSDEEETAVSEKISTRQFFGETVSHISKKTLKDFTLVEFTRNAPCTGSAGPGSKAWVWPLAFCLLLFSKKKN